LAVAPITSGKVDRDVLIAISSLKNRAGTARSSLRSRP